VDIDARWNPDIQVDVLDWDYRSCFNPGDFHTVVASPPCTEFSTALTTRARELDKADLLAKKALEIIDYLQPSVWWLENPRNGLLKTREYMQGIPYLDVDYCQYADWGYMKPTRIWGSPQLQAITPKRCDGTTCPNLVPGPQGSKRPHRVRLSSPSQNLKREKKYPIPESLVQQLMRISSPSPRSARSGVVSACPVSYSDQGLQKRGLRSQGLSCRAPQLHLNGSLCHRGW